jgi:hypothetical protein
MLSGTPKQWSLQRARIMPNREVKCGVNKYLYTMVYIKYIYDFALNFALKGRSLL